MKQPVLSFDALSPAEQAALARYERLLRDMNRKINLVSRETDDEVRERHTLHCLAFRLRAFPPGSVLVDWGTGGGLPSIPLAVLNPQVTIHAVDAVGKKIQAVRAMARRLGLDNLQAEHARAESWDGQAHYAVSRATAPLADLWSWFRPVAVPMEVPEDAWQPGLVCLKGGDLTDEIAALQAVDPAVRVEEIPLEPLLRRPYFADKALVAVTSTGDGATL